MIRTLLILTITAFSLNALAEETKYKSVESSETTISTEAFKGSPMPQNMDAAVGIGFGFFDSFGLQSRAGYRLLEEGFIPDLNDALFVEAGLGLTMYGSQKNYSNVTGFHLASQIRWDFNYNQDWVIFSTLGFGYNFVSNVNRNKDMAGGGPFPTIGAGVMYNIEKNWLARFDLSYQFLGVGMGYRF